MFKILGTNDAVNSCDCCGKSNLKSTVIVDMGGEILHYGSVCATRHTKLTSAEIKAAIKSESDGRVEAARKMYKNSSEAINAAVKLAQANRQGIKPGKEFMEFCRVTHDAAQIVARRIAAEFGVEVHQVQY